MGRRKPGAESAEVPPPGSDQLMLALAELQVHQVELEMQNEELRRAQVQLDLSRARYFDLYDLAPIGYCTLSVVGLIVHANLTAATMLGHTRASVIGRGFSRFVDREDQGVWHALLQRLPESTEPESMELRLVRYDGTVFWAHVIITSALNEAGAPERRVTLNDVSARRAAETGRREGEARYRELFSRAPTGIVVCATDGAVENVNDSFRRLHGWEGKVLAGLNLRTLDRQGIALSSKHMGRMLAGEVSTFDVEHHHADGHAFGLEASTSLIYDSGVPRMLGYYRDISECRSHRTERPS